jgi:hypothetical protein
MAEDHRRTVSALLTSCRLVEDVRQSSPGVSVLEGGLALLQEAESILATRNSNNKPSALEIKALESAVVANKESKQCVPPHVAPASTSTHTYMY